MIPDATAEDRTRDADPCDIAINIVTHSGDNADRLVGAITAFIAHERKRAERERDELKNTLFAKQTLIDAAIVLEAERLECINELRKLLEHCRDYHPLNSNQRADINAALAKGAG